MRTIKKDQEIKSSHSAALLTNTESDTNHLHLLQIWIISGLSLRGSAEASCGWASLSCLLLHWIFCGWSSSTAYLQHVKVLVGSLTLLFCVYPTDWTSTVELVRQWTFTLVLMKLHKDFKIINKKVLNMILLFIQLQMHTPSLTVVSFWLYAVLHGILCNSILI